MPGAIIRNPTPDWLKPENASVFDSYWKQIARKVGHLIGADDPAAQAMGVLTADVPAAGTQLTAAAQAVVDAAKELPGAQRLATWIRAFHGSPHDFPQFDASKIGTGEGAQAYGHGLYFAENPKIAEGYKRDLGKVVKAFDGAPVTTSAEDMAHDILSRASASGNQAETLQRALQTVDEWGDAGVFRGPNEGKAMLDVKRAISDNVDKKLGTTIQGKTYEVNIKADPAHFLDWDAPLSAQSPEVQQGVAKAWGMSPEQFAARVDPNARGAALYSRAGHGDQVQATEAFKRAGIPGIKYLDAGSRAAGEGSRNYVAFDDKLIDILRKYGFLPPVAGLGYLSQVGQPQKPEPR